MIEISNLSLQFNGDYLFKDVSLKIHAGDKISLVGSNGAGKTSLFRLINKEYQPESGGIYIQKKVKVGYLPQEQIVHSGKTLLEEIASGAIDILQIREHEKVILESLEGELPEEDREELIYQLGTIHHQLESLNSYSLESRIQRVTRGLGFSNDDSQRLTDEFSGGWQMRIAIAKILVAEPDIILLDEPTNHLDIQSQQWLISFLKGFRGVLILISHDRYFVNQVTDKTIEIFLKKISLFKGNYDAYIKYKLFRDEQLEHQAELQEKRRRETQLFIDRFRYKATKAKQVQSRIRYLDKMEMIELPDFENRIEFSFLDPPPCGSISFELKKISLSYAEKNILEDINLIVQRGEKIAFVGPNGAGKTTLARIIAGDLEATTGSRVVGHNVQFAFYTQNTTELLDTEKDVMETILPFSEGRTIAQIRALAGAFLFQGDDVFKKVANLSGGEKSRLALLTIMLTRSNTLIFDEPTNHLDFDSKKVLQDALMRFEGTVIIVSHDIDFLSFPLTRVLEIKPGKVQEYSGDISYYLSKTQVENDEIISTTGEPKSSKNDLKGEDDARNALSKKEAKRIEAEKRNLKYKHTKGISSEITNLEFKISAVEEKIKESEVLLGLPETYNIDGKAAEVTLSYRNQKELLKNLYEQWESLQLKLEEIEKQFE